MLLPLIAGGASAIAQFMGANRAANAQEAIADRQMDLAEDIYWRQRHDMQPYRQAGRNALADFRDRLGDGPQQMSQPDRINAPSYADIPTVNAPQFTDPARINTMQYRNPTRVRGPNYDDFNFRAGPGYQFQQREGQRAVEGAAAAQGGMLSGATLAALQDRRQGLADQTYDRERNVFRDDYFRRAGMNQANYMFDRQMDTADRQYATGMNNQNYWADRTADADGFWRAQQANQSNYWADRGMDNQNFWQATLQNRDDLWRTRAFNEDRRNTYMDRLAGLANLGFSAASGTANAAGAMGAAQSNALSAIGNARSAGAIGMGNAISGGIDNALALWAYYNPPNYNQQYQPQQQSFAPTSAPIPPSRPF